MLGFGAKPQPWPEAFFRILTLGFILSGVIQAVVSQERMREAFGRGSGHEHVPLAPRSGYAIAPFRVEPGVISTLMLSIEFATRIAWSQDFRSYSWVTMPLEVTKPRLSRSIAIG